MHKDPFIYSLIHLSIHYVVLYIFKVKLELCKSQYYAFSMKSTNPVHYLIIVTIGLKPKIKSYILNLPHHRS